MNIKIKKKILVCMLWLCAIACFTGFPWIFFSWDVIHSYMGIHDIPSDLTIVLFREECLFFGFFCIYFLFLRNIEKYKGLISFCSFLVAFMGGFMYLLKLQTGIVHISSDYEPFIWLIIGSFIFYLNHSINGIAPKKQKLPVLSCLFQVQAGVLLLNIVNILVPEQTWEIMFNISYSTVSPYDKYTFGMISGFTAFSSIIIYYISNRILFFMNLSKAILIFSFLYFLGFFVWGNFSELYKPLFILYVVLVEILNIVGINYIFKRRIYEGLVDDLITSIPGEWKFDEQVSQHFDTHVRKSVPLYEEVQKAVIEISEWFIRDNSVVYDLGSSTGETISLLLQKHSRKKNVRFIGVEESLPMIEIARKKCSSELVQFLQQHIEEINEFANIDLVLSLYTLQFLPLWKRKKVLQRIYNGLVEGGAFIFVEKIRAENSLFEDIWNDLYWDFKQENGLNEQQVIKKAQSLRGVLIPLSLTENLSLLSDVGFQCMDTFIKWHNFAGIIAVKMPSKNDIEENTYLNTDKNNKIQQ